MSKILFIDAYDSFSNNIISLLRDHLSVHIELVHIDDPRFVLNDDAFFQHLRGFDAVVLGPGPGHPARPNDTGLINKLWTLPDDHILPILGICLGFQTLCLAFGASATRLSQPRHGLVTEIAHCGLDIFATSAGISATQYHSLHVCLWTREGLPTDTDLWAPSPACPDLVPLAWDLSDATNGPILMAARHAQLPFWGVQYHPESICTSQEGQKLVREWWRRALAWNTTHRDPRRAAGPSTIPNGNPSLACCKDTPTANEADNKVQWVKTELSDDLDVAGVVERLRAECSRYNPIVLESGVHRGVSVNPETGRFSIIGLHDARCVHVRYSTADHRLTVTSADQIFSQRLCPIEEVWQCLNRLTQEHRAVGGPQQVPFWGGFVGYVSYEAGLEGIDVLSANVDPNRPDIWFVLVERSIVVDHASGTAFLQTLRQDDHKWLDNMRDTLERTRHCSEDSIATASNQPAAPATMLNGPSRDEYRRKVRDCQSHLRAGSSYELCLTDQTIVRSGASPWALYKRLRQSNPAPFAAYLELAGYDGSGHLPLTKGVAAVSSSPERFLSWSRAGKCQFRPIKGTLKKGAGIDRAVAERVLACPKEQAENLMIVDLIRHDLNGVARQGSVHVPQLMAVEEYATVFQLVSVIEGELDAPGSGIDALAASLPPGSMTGAPKKRSCELLRELEGRARGLYSGVLGYLDVGGGGDFSVVIRTAYRWDGDDWVVGAGGAVTVLSEEEAEFEEMVAKREALLKVFSVKGDE